MTASHRYHRARNVTRLALLLVLFALMLTTGCAREMDRRAPSGSAAAGYAKWSASGKRVAVVDEAGKTVLKLRERRDSFKVYDADFIAVGFVRWDAAKDAPKDAPLVVSLQPLARSSKRSITEVRPGVYELADQLRIEQTDRGWAVFDPKAELLGLLERDGEETWTLRRTSNDKPAWSARRTDGWTVATTPNSSARRRANSKAWTPAAVLATELESLDIMQRVALAAWFIHGAPEVTSG